MDYQHLLLYEEILFIGITKPMSSYYCKILSDLARNMLNCRGLIEICLHTL